MDMEFERCGIRFVANQAKMTTNIRKHGVAPEQAAEVFFDPFLKLVDASRHGEQREAVIGMDTATRVLFVVHAMLEEDRIRLVSARKATREERLHYEND